MVKMAEELGCLQRCRAPCTLAYQCSCSMVDDGPGPENLRDIETPAA